MKLHLTLAAIAIFLMQPYATNARTLPSIEQSIYQPTPPFVDLKQSIYVRESERRLLPLISSASDSIIPFLIDMHDSKKTVASIRQVIEQSRSMLRVPPQATFGQGRFVDMMVYCWTSDNEDQLKFLIEWADLTTKARYTDSYVFIRHGGSWFFEKHGTVAPSRWTQTQRYFRRGCPTDLRTGDI